MRAKVRIILSIPTTAPSFLSPSHYNSMTKAYRKERTYKKMKKNRIFEYNLSKKSIPLRRFNKAIDCITF